MILFRALRWKNLLSTGNQFTELQLDKSPTTLILGANGSGKSTALDALCYGLFKKPFRKINKDQLINTINGGECEIEIEFSIGTDEYKVRRGINPDFFEVLKNGGPPRKQEAAKKDDQKFLEEDILKVNFDAFTQVVILGNAKYTPFMQLTTPKRRAFIEHILDIGVFSTMNDILGTRQKTIKRDLEGIGNDIFSVEEQITLVQGFIKKLHDEANRAKDEIEAKISQGSASVDKLLGEIETLTEQVNELSETISDNDNVVSRIQFLADTERKINQNISSAKSRIEFYAENDSCNTCGQSIQQTHRETITLDKNKQLEKYQEGLTKLANERATFQKRLQEIKVVSKEIQTLNAHIQEKSNTIRATRTYVAKLEADLKKEPGNVKEQEEKVQLLEQKLVDYERQKEEFVEQRHFYEVAAVLLKDTGIKAAIIKHYLPAINRLVNKYLEDLDFFLSFSLDEQFNETLKSRNRDTLSYFSFSEGEKLRIDLALLFTWREIARGKNSCATNLLILDEVIDSSLDQDGTDYVIRMFNELGKMANVFVISHKNDAAMDKFTDV